MCVLDSFPLMLALLAPYLGLGQLRWIQWMFYGEVQQKNESEAFMKWITRKDVKVDRVACPWLVKHFVDPQAEFLFVDENELLERAEREKAIPFDAPRIEAIKLNHRGPRCTFEAIIEDYAISDPALQQLALIVRAADIKGQETVAAEGIGLRSIAQGFAAMGLTDEDRLARQFPVYDALYAYVQTLRK